jgi:membrane-bound lytic murein transglycosylase B
MPHLRKALFLSALFFCVSAPAMATNGQSFDSWLQNFKSQARSSGVSEGTITAALTGIQPIQKVIDLDRKQPEMKKSFAQYKEQIVNAKRVQDGREYLQTYAADLAEVERMYGVAPQYVVALWGIETNYGTNTGGFMVVPALATLAWEGRRAEFFGKELMNALKIIDAGHISAAAMKGSWAGAMGQNQFMPTSFNAFAVDGNGDGKRDIWGTKKDVFASTANYLNKSGWRHGERWGRRAHIPSNFPENLIGPKIKKPMAEWARLGVTLPGGAALPSDNIMASVVAPDGVTGEAYIVYNNYQTIMAWNRSTYFATSVGLLADRLAQ